MTESVKRCLFVCQIVPLGSPAAFQCGIKPGGRLSLDTAESLKTVRIVKTDWEILFLFDKLISTAKTEAPHGELVLNSVVVLLLDALLTPKDTTGAGYPQNPIVRTAVDYINQNLGQPLTIQRIAQSCSISPSSLSHIFQKEMYISVHKFILKKRLMQAYHRIHAGEAAAVAVLECGFQDYSGFYKQYKKVFGFPPSQRG